MDLRDRRDARRLAVAVAAAVAVHAGLLVVVPLLTSLDTAPLPDYGPVIVRVELPAAVIEPQPAPAAASEPAPAAATPAPTPPRTVAKPVPAAKPATPAPKPATTAAAAPKPATTTAQADAPARAPGTSAFRQSGAATGVSAGTVDASVTAGPPPVALPPAGVSTAGGGEQRSGEAVALSGRPTGGTGTIDTSTKKLDTALAASGGTTGGSGSTAPGTATPGATTRAGSPTLIWDNATAAAGREWRVAPKPTVPSRLRDFVYEVRIAFTANADGVVTTARVKLGSGDPELDEACRAAVLKARITSAPGAPLVSGTQVFVP